MQNYPNSKFSKYTKILKIAFEKEKVHERKNRFFPPENIRQTHWKTKTFSEHSNFVLAVLVIASILPAFQKFHFAIDFFFIFMIKILCQRIAYLKVWIRIY